jgi:hypothetical protein
VDSHAADTPQKRIYGPGLELIMLGLDEPMPTPVALDGADDGVEASSNVFHEKK